MLKILIILALIGITLAMEKKTCKEKIMEDFPDSECIDGGADDIKDCEAKCHIIGQKECQGRMGKMSKRICNQESKNEHQGKITCCCSIDCEHKNVTMARINKRLKDKGITVGSYKCVTASMKEIKEKMKMACRQEKRVLIAKKYCLEEHQGKSFNCLKEGKCSGNLCKGCIKHECIKIKNGKKQKEILNPPKNYVRTMLESGNILVDPNNPINVEDRAHLTHHKKWCTKVPNIQQNTFQHECVKICKKLGKLLCRSEPEKIEPTSDCVGNEKTCKCCCKPSCDESKIVDECNPPTEPTATIEDTTELPCEMDGFAGNYDDYQGKTTPCNKKGTTIMPEPGWKESGGATTIYETTTMQEGYEYEESQEIQEESGELEEIKGETRIRKLKNKKKQKKQKNTKENLENKESA